MGWGWGALRILLASTPATKSWAGAGFDALRAPRATSGQTPSPLRCVLRSGRKGTSGAGTFPPNYPPRANLAFPPAAGRMHPEPEKGSRPRQDSRCAVTYLPLRFSVWGHPG